MPTDNNRGEMTMNLASRKWLYFVSGIILLGLFILTLQNLTNNVTADQGINRAANLNLNRTITTQSGSDITNGIIQQGDSFFLNYNITPVDITGISKSPSQQIRISNITFTEVLPANIEIDTKLLPSGFTSSGSKSIGYTITANLGDINYRWDSATQSLKPDLTSNSRFNGEAIVFSVPARSTLSQNYTFANSSLDYNDLHEVSSATTPTPTPTSTFDPTISNSGSTLGVIGDYGLFVLNDGSSEGNSSIKGNLAVGRDLSLNGGGTITGNVIVGNNFNYLGNFDIKGNVIVGNTLTFGTNNKDGIKGSNTSGKPIDFDVVKDYWITKSKEYGMLVPNGTATLNGDQLNLKVTNKFLPVYIFKVSEQQISAAVGIILDTPLESTVIINVEGKNINMSKWTTLNGKSEKKILYNFTQAEQLTFTSFHGVGTYLAPLANINSTNGSFIGSIIVSSWIFGSTGSGINIEASPFIGELPIIPTPTPSATASPSPSSPPVAIPHATKDFSPVGVSVFSLEITGKADVFKDKSIDLTLITGNLPSNAEITWSLLDDGANYATLTGTSVDKKNYKLTGKDYKDGIIVSVTTGGATTNHVVNVIPFSLTGLKAKEGIEISVGQDYDLNQLLWITPNEMTIGQIKKDLEWISNNPSIASFDSSLTEERKGYITGIQKGGPIIVTVLYKPSVDTNPIKTTIKVKVIAQENGDRY